MHEPRAVLELCLTHQVVLSFLRADARACKLPVIRLNVVATHGTLHRRERVGGHLMRRKSVSVRKCMRGSVGLPPTCNQRYKQRVQCAAHLVPKPATAAVNHDTDLADAVDSHLVCCPSVVDFVHHLSRGSHEHRAPAADGAACKRAWISA